MVVIVAQLAAWSLLIPEDPGSNPAIGNFYWTIIYCQLFVEKTEINKKRQGIAHLKKERKKQTNKQRIIKREREKKKFKIERDDVAINQRQKQSFIWGLSRWDSFQAKTMTTHTKRLLKIITIFEEKLEIYVQNRYDTYLACKVCLPIWAVVVTRVRILTWRLDDEIFPNRKNAVCQMLKKP